MGKLTCRFKDKAVFSRMCFPASSDQPQGDEVLTMHAVVLALLHLALIKMLPDLVRYMQIRSM
jgi:hypothetical protein